MDSAEKVPIKIAITNLKRNHYRALASLKKRKDIIIKKADKGSAVVIQNREDYIREAERQLSNTKNYRKLAGPAYPATANLINEAVDELLELGEISEKQAEYLRPPKVIRPRIFYLLP